MKFLSQINVNTEYTLPMVDGTNGQVLSTDGAGVAYWGTISAGSLTLDGLSDVIITSPSSDQMLRYGLRQGDTIPVWHNFTPNFLTPSSSINALNDVVITTAAAGQILQYNGSNWVNATLSTVEYVSKVQHTVKAGVAITKGQAVYVTGSNGTNMIVGLASNTSEGTSSKTMGLAASTAAINDNIFVVTEGLLAGLDTSTATAGDPVWLGTNGNLIFGLVNKPVAPAHLVYLGVVTRVQANNGEIFVHVQNGFELHEIHDVLISSPSTGQLLQRASDGLWKNWTPNFLTAHPGILAASSVNNSNGTVIQDITLETNGHVTGLASVNLDTRYYTESEIDSFFGGESEIAGYNQSNWDTAYGWGDHAAAGYLTSIPAHTHTIANVTGLQTALDGKAASSHTHAASDITSGTLSTDRLPKQELGISIVGNFGQWQAHTAYTNFNTDVAYWGWTFVQGNTNAPHQISSQWYRGRFSLGDEYGFGTSSGDYWMEIAIPRNNQSSTSGNLFVRTCENGGINAWQGVRAAYATEASSAAYAEESGYSASSGSVEWTNVQSKPATFPPSAHNHDDRYYTETESDSRFYLATNPNGYITSSGNTSGYSGSLSADDNRTISPSEIGANRLKFGFTSWTNNNQPPYADYLHLRSYGDSSGGSDNLVMFKKSGIGMRIWQQTFGSGNAYSSYADVWTTGDFSSTDVSNWNEAYGWGDHAAANYASEDFVTSQGYITGSYLPLTGGTLSGAIVVNLGNVSSDTVAFKVGGPANYDSLTIGMEDSPDYDAFIASYGNDIRFYSGKGLSSENHSFYWFTSKAGTSQHSVVAMQLDHNQNLTIGGTFTEQSSIRYKENVKSIPSVSQKVEQLDAVSYNKIGSTQEEIGLIAEDVAELFPEVVKYDDEGRPDGVNYSRLSVILLKAVQELTERVNKLENK